MKASIRRKLQRRKQRIDKRLDRTNVSGPFPMLDAANIHYDVADRTRAISAGGIGMIHRMVKWLGLEREIDQGLSLFKLYLPYTESDHVLNIAYNLLAGGSCLEHLELRRNDENYLDALGARRIPDPTTAGDFCRRFNWLHIEKLQDIFNTIRLRVWKQQRPDFFDEAIIDADGTMVETTGECKAGIDINHKGQWGYHPLLVSLANTGEPLFLANRRGNRPSHEGASEYLNRAVQLCVKAGFRRIVLRGDTDFTQTPHLDEWDAQQVHFVLGMDASPALYKRAEALELTAWQRLERSTTPIKTQPRRRPTNFKQQVVTEREFLDIRLAQEYVAEFEYSPTKCRKTYRVIAVWKDLEVWQGQQLLFPDDRCFFYITNDRQSSPADIVRSARQRCNQENTIEQLKNGVRSLTAPLDNLVSNWAYMVMGSLAWTLKIWAALLTPVDGRWKEPHQEQKQRLLRMDFSTFRNAFILVPAQIVRTSRRIIYRLLAWNSWQPTFFRLLDAFKRPLRC